jgi:hypothetical protein
MQYYEKWFRAKRRPIGPLTESQARARYNNGEPFIALFEDVNGAIVVDFGGVWVTVSFLDELRRIFLKYNFKTIEPDKVFLSQAMQLGYVANGDAPVSAVTFSFDVNGTSIIERKDLMTGSVEEKISKFDVEGNFDSYPKFGDYSKICQMERHHWTPRR